MCLLKTKAFTRGVLSLPVGLRYTAFPNNSYFLKKFEIKNHRLAGRSANRRTK